MNGDDDYSKDVMVWLLCAVRRGGSILIIIIIWDVWACPPAYQGRHSAQPLPVVTHGNVLPGIYNPGINTTLPLNKPLGRATFESPCSTK